MQNLEHLLAELETLAAKRRVVVYNIQFRRSGVSICWHEEERMKRIPPHNSENQEKLHQDSLIVYEVYGSLRECVEGELLRLRQKGFNIVS